MSIGLTMPFRVSSGSVGYFDTTQDEFEALNQDIHSLLITNWGERPMHYDLGCNLREFIFEPKVSNELKTRIANRIIEQLNRWLPFVELTQLNVLFTEDESDIPENAVRIDMKYKLTSKPDLSGVGTFIVRA